MEPITKYFYQSTELPMEDIIVRTVLQDNNFKECLDHTRKEIEKILCPVWRVE